PYTTLFRAAHGPLAGHSGQQPGGVPAVRAGGGGRLQAHPQGVALGGEVVALHDQVRTGPGQQLGRQLTHEELALELEVAVARIAHAPTLPAASQVNTWNSGESGGIGR